MDAVDRIARRLARVECSSCLDGEESVQDRRGFLGRLLRIGAATATAGVLAGRSRDASAEPSTNAWCQWSQWWECERFWNANVGEYWYTGKGRPVTRTTSCHVYYGTWRCTANCPKDFQGPC